jgi:hypothetical protein
MATFRDLADGFQTHQGVLNKFTKAGLKVKNFLEATLSKNIQEEIDRGILENLLSLSNDNSKQH